MELTLSLPCSDTFLPATPRASGRVVTSDKLSRRVGKTKRIPSPQPHHLPSSLSSLFSRELANVRGFSFFQREQIEWVRGQGQVPAAGPPQRPLLCNHWSGLRTLPPDCPSESLTSLHPQVPVLAFRMPKGESQRDPSRTRGNGRRRVTCREKRKGGQELASSLEYCSQLTVSGPQIHLLKPNPQADGFCGWGGLGELIRS